MQKQVNTWAPTLRDNEDPSEDLRVPCGPEPPKDREEYRQRLCDRMQVLIDSHPKEAGKVLEELSTPEYPQLSIIRAGYPVRYWAFQITSSDQTGMFLSRIDWQKISPVKKQSVEELPSLMDYLQMIPI